jgi:hypothetical protein
MMERPRRLIPPKAAAWWLGLPALSAGLVAIGIWLDQQFDASRGPVRDSSPEVVVWVSLAAVGLVLTLWFVAELASRRGRRPRRSRRGRS